MRDEWEGFCRVMETDGWEVKDCTKCCRSDECRRNDG